jgi:hypothetical protein
MKISDESKFARQAVDAIIMALRSNPDFNTVVVDLTAPEIFRLSSKLHSIMRGQIREIETFIVGGKFEDVREK